MRRLKAKKKRYLILRPNLSPKNGRLSSPLILSGKTQDIVVGWRAQEFQNIEVVSF
jgi:hypothetical protein